MRVSGKLSVRDKSRLRSRDALTVKKRNRQILSVALTVRDKSRPRVRNALTVREEATTPAAGA